MVNFIKVIRRLVFTLLLPLFSAALVSLASAQSFTLTVLAPLSPPGVDPGGSAIATLDLESVSGFNSSVSFTDVPCAVTPVQASGTPICTVSPDSAVPSARPSVTVTTIGTTPAGLYTITVTGTSGSLLQTVSLNLSVVDVTEDYTLSVSPTTATPNPIAAGNSATTTVTVTPIASYTGNVTLACLSVSPVTALSPVCSFNPPTVQVTSGVPPTSILTLSTTGPATSLWDRRIFYGLWMVLPGIVLVMFRANARVKEKLIGGMVLTVAAAGLWLLPACNATKSTSGSNTTVTPSNTYTFTLTGADQNGAGPSSTTAATVSVTVQ